MSEKKFANTHYPGMKIDPKELQSQSQKNPLREHSILFLTSSGEFYLIAQKIKEFEIGRLGWVKNDLQDSSEEMEFNELKEKLKAPDDLELEFFSFESKERLFEDIARGFSLIIGKKIDQTRYESLQESNSKVIIKEENFFYGAIPKRKCFECFSSVKNIQNELRTQDFKNLSEFIEWSIFSWNEAEIFKMILNEDSTLTLKLFQSRSGCGQCEERSLTQI